MVLAALLVALSADLVSAGPDFPSSSVTEPSTRGEPVAPVPPAVAPAIGPEAPSPPPAVSMRWAGVRVGGAVVAVGLLLLGGVAGYRKLVERAGGSRSAGGRRRARPGWWPFWAPDAPAEADRIHLASRRYLGPRESLGVVRVGRERFLVGITGASISLLARLGEDPLRLASAEERPAASHSHREPEAVDFAAELEAVGETEPRRAFLRPPTIEAGLADPAPTDTAIRARITRSRNRLARLGRLTAVAQASRD